MASRMGYVRARGRVPETDAAIEITRTACAGAASAYALRQVASRAGSYAPGIDDRLFFELSRDSSGIDLMRVTQWFASRGPELSRLGYRVGARMVAFRTEAIQGWVKDGDGYRAAVLATACEVLHPQSGGDKSSAVALVNEVEKGKRRLMIADPWPEKPNRREPPEVLAEAHRRSLNRALLLYWFGWS
jgi:hypothetical protein